LSTNEKPTVEARYRDNLYGAKIYCHHNTRVQKPTNRKLPQKLTQIVLKETDLISEIRCLIPNLIFFENTTCNKKLKAFQQIGNVPYYVACLAHNVLSSIGDLMPKATKQKWS
jgi:hypothetical protein